MHLLLWNRMVYNSAFCYFRCRDFLVIQIKTLTFRNEKKNRSLRRLELETASCQQYNNHYIFVSCSFESSHFTLKQESIRFIPPVAIFLGDLFEFVVVWPETNFKEEEEEERKKRSHLCFVFESDLLLLFQSEKRKRFMYVFFMKMWPVVCFFIAFLVHIESSERDAISLLFSRMKT